MKGEGRREKSERGAAAELRKDLRERTFGFAARVVRLCRILDRRAGVPRTLANQLV